jgi:hypothetical protein
MKQFSSKFLGVAIAVLLLATVTFAAPAAKPKATGDADWIQRPTAYNQQANLTFNAINTKARLGWRQGLSDLHRRQHHLHHGRSVLKVVGNTAWFAGQVTSVTVTETILLLHVATGFSTRWLTTANPELMQTQSGRRSDRSGYIPAAR